VMSVKRPQPPPKVEPASKPARVEPMVTAPVRQTPPEPDPIPSSDRVPSDGLPKPERERVKKQQAATAPKPGKQPRQLQDPLARVAMSLVGADPDAEAYWLEAIYDSNLPD